MSEIHLLNFAYCFEIGLIESINKLVFFFFNKYDIAQSGFYKYSTFLNRLIQKVSDNYNMDLEGTGIDLHQDKLLGGARILSLYHNLNNTESLTVRSKA